MELLLLGPVELRVGGEAVALGPRQPRAVLAMLALEEANTGHPETDDVLEAARYVQSTVIPAMEAAREVADRLERIVPDSLWPLPKYAEILFIK